MSGALKIWDGTAWRYVASSDRSTHTGTQQANTISDLPSVIDGRISTALSGFTTGNVTRVVYGTGAVPARPAGAVYVDWVGTNDPTANMLSGDSWAPT